MPDIYRVTYSGLVATSEDMFMFGFYLQSDEDSEGLAARVAAASPGWLSSRFVGLTWRPLRVSRIVEGTGAVDDVAEVAMPAITAAGGNPLPSEVATCVTIRPVTGLINGRFYLPPLQVTVVDINGRLASATQDNLALGTKTFFQTTLGAASSPARLGIYSRKNHNYVGASRIEVGNVFDSQRRRRNKMYETRVGYGIL